MRILVVVSLVCVLSGCTERPSEVAALRDEVATLAGEIEQMKERAAEAEKEIKDLRNSVELPKFALVTCTDSAFAPVQTNNGMLLITCEEAVPYLTGFKLKLRIGNPQFMRFEGLKLTIASAVSDDERSTEVKVSTAIQPGAWTKTKAFFPDATVEHLKVLSFKVHASQVGLLSGS